MFLILANIFLLSLLISKKLEANHNTFQVLNLSLLINLIFCLFFTEFLSFWGILNRPNILICWILILFINFLLLKKNNINIHKKFIVQTKLLTQITLKSEFKIIYFSVLIILMIILIQGILYPPNNYDSMTYHLPRVIHWIDNQSINHYATNIFRQLYQPPFSEFLILNDYLIFNSDLFSSFIQFSFLIFSVLVIINILRISGFNKLNLSLIICLIISIPELILQASSTQNDIVVSYFILNSVYYLLLMTKKLNLTFLIGFSVSIGLGVLTKATAYIFFFPILLFFLYTILNNKENHLKFKLISLSVSSFIVLAINFGHFYRNFLLSESILGTNKEESKMYSNINLGPITTISNFVKNTAIHFNNFKMNNFVDSIIYDLFNLFGVGINNNGVNFGNITYSVGNKFLPTHEDYAANTIHLILIFISIIYMFSLKFRKNLSNKIIEVITTIVVIQFFLFCFYLKWQPWHTRLQLPIFLFAIPIVYFFIIKIIVNDVLLKTICFFLIFNSFFIVLFNETRPLIKSSYSTNFFFNGGRFKNYFTNRPDLYLEYKVMSKKLKESKNIGLILNSDDYEYPLISKINIEKDQHFYHIEIKNISKIKIEKKELDCIVSTYKKKYLSYNNRIYFNKSPKNKKIWIYK